MDSLKGFQIRALVSGLCTALNLLSRKIANSKNKFVMKLQDALITNPFIVKLYTASILFYVLQAVVWAVSLVYSL